MSSSLEAVCPLFCRSSGERTQQIASGVLLRILDQVFLLTSAHVLDYETEGDILLIPGKDCLTPICGHRAHIPVVAGSTREDDKIDIAYYRLLPELANALDSHFRVLGREDVSLCDDISPGDLYSFFGWPWRKAKVHGNLHTSEPYTYTGPAVGEDIYKKLGYDIKGHILIDFNRKRAFSSIHKAIKTAPLPEGVSGGGVFVWPKDFMQRPQAPDPKLVGIFHSYYRSEHCVAATRINTYIAFIFHNHPNLNVHKQDDPEAGLPLLVSMVWYRKEDWSELRSLSEDADKMFATWQEWRQAALANVERFSRLGRVVVPVTVTAKEIVAFCHERDLPVDGFARADIANLKFGHSMFGREVEVGQ